MRFRTLSLLLLLGSLALPALAQDKDESKPPKMNDWGKTPKEDPKVSLSLGIGSLIGHNNRINNQTWPYNARTYVRVIPMGEFRYGRLRLMGPFANYSLHQSRAWGASLKTGIQGDQYRGLDMEERDWSFFAGASLRIKFIEFSYSRDLQNVSDGSLYTIATGPRFPLSKKIFLMSGIEATYLDKNYSDYYYGVRPNEATADRPVYDLNGAWTYALTLRPIISLTERWILMTSVKLSFYDKKIENSPTVRDGEGVSGMIGLTYKFL